MKSKYQPTLEPRKTLGTYNNVGNPSEFPIFCIEEYTQRKKTLPSQFNLVNYVDSKDYFDRVRYV
jgi:hypothetical protein